MAVTDLHEGTAMPCPYGISLPLFNQIHFTIRGDKHQPVVLFLHGFLGNCEDFDPIVRQLSDPFCCLSVDLPGHGQTQVAEEDYTMSNTAALIVHLLDCLDISQCYLIGYSMGGRLALYLALQFPDRFLKTVLESASPGLKTEAERLARKQHDARLADRLESNFPAFLADWYEQPLFRSLKQHPNFEQVIQQRLKNRPSELARSLRHLGTGEQPSLWNRLKVHQNPLLLLVGERDRKFASINQEMANDCKVAQLKIIPNAGHNIHVEDPQIFARFVHEFLQNFGEAS